MTLHTLRTQLNSDSGTQGDDCGAVTCINGIIWASDGKIGPKSQGEVGDWVRKVRRWAIKSRGGLLLQGDCLQIYNHPELTYMFHKAGLMPMRAEYKFKIGWYSLVKRIQSGQFCHLALDYGTLRRGTAPMGSDTFSGGHSIGLLLAPSHRGHVYAWDGDPLFDGRRGEYPRGWQSARLLAFRAAAGDWGMPVAGDGHAYAIFLRRG